MCRSAKAPCTGTRLKCTHVQEHNLSHLCHCTIPPHPSKGNAIRLGYGPLAIMWMNLCVKLLGDGIAILRLQGTLSDSEAIHWQSYKRVFAEQVPDFPANPISRAYYMQNMGGRTKVWQNLSWHRYSTASLCKGMLRPVFSKVWRSFCLQRSEVTSFCDGMTSVSKVRRMAQFLFAKNSWTTLPIPCDVCTACKQDTFPEWNPDASPLRWRVRWIWIMLLRQICTDLSNLFLLDACSLLFSDVAAWLCPRFPRNVKQPASCTQCLHLTLLQGNLAGTSACLLQLCINFQPDSCRPSFFWTVAQSYLAGMSPRMRVDWYRSRNDFWKTQRT